MKNKLNSFIKVFSQTVLISGFVIFVVCPLSCHITTEGVEFVGGDYISPKLLNFNVVDDKHIILDFSEKVNVAGIVVNKKVENEQELNVTSVSTGDSEGQVVVHLGESADIGGDYVLGGIVEDKYGNTLTFSLTFAGYNPNIPKIIITEVMPIHKNDSKNQKTSCEYVEIMALEDGNLFGLTIGSVGTKEINDYKLPAVNVKKGELIVIHLRNKGEGCISEVGDNLSLANSNYCNSDLRDLWSENTGSALSDDGDVIYIKDIINNKYVEGVAYHHTSKTEWDNEKKQKILELIEDNIFENDDINNSIELKSRSSVNSITRSNMVELQKKVLDNENIENINLNDYKNWSTDINASPGKL